MFGVSCRFQTRQCDLWPKFHEVVFSADEAVRRCKDGEKVILVRIETSPDDIHGLHAAEGVLTTRGKGCPAVMSAKDLVRLKKK